MSQLENGQSFKIFRDVNPTKLADVTGGASASYVTEHDTKDVTGEPSKAYGFETIALWRDGGVHITIRDGITDWSWRGVLQGYAHILPDSAVLFGTDDIKVVLPAGEDGPVRGFKIANGRIRGFEANPTSTNNPLRMAAVFARDVFVAKQEAASRTV